MAETDWKAVHRMEEAAQRASNAAQQCEDAATRIAHLLEDRYGGNGLRLIEALESANAEATIASNDANTLLRRDLAAARTTIDEQANEITRLKSIKSA
jgi:hypothetical protein